MLIYDLSVHGEHIYFELYVEYIAQQVNSVLNKAYKTANEIMQII